VKSTDGFANKQKAGQKLGSHNLRTYRKMEAAHRQSPRSARRFDNRHSFHLCATCPMTRPRLATLVCVTLLAALVSFGMPWISIYTLGRIRLLFTVMVSTIALIVAFAIAMAAIVFHARRGLWTILAAIPAFFWPVVAISIATACSIYDCD
jgi:hypothetical protein